MSWYYNKVNGDVYEATGVQKWLTDREIQFQKLPVGPGVLAPGVTAQTLFGPFNSQQDAQNFKDANPSVVDQAKKQITGPITDVTSAITGATNTLVKLSIRWAEAALGIVLLAIALNAVLKQATGVDVAGSARKAGKGAAKAAAAAAVV